MRMKRPQGYNTIKSPHCGEKIRVVFRTLHRLKIEFSILSRNDDRKDWNVKQGKGD